MSDAPAKPTSPRQETAPYSILAPLTNAGFRLPPLTRRFAVPAVPTQTLAERLPSDPR